MNTTFYQNCEKRINSTKNPTTGVLTMVKDVKLKEGTSIGSPSLLLSSYDRFLSTINSFS